MIGFLALMVALAATVCFGFCWISWEAPNPKSRPGFRTKMAHDCARLFRRDRAAAPVPRASGPHVSVGPAPAAGGV